MFGWFVIINYPNPLLYHVVCGVDIYIRVIPKRNPVFCLTFQFSDKLTWVYEIFRYTPYKQAHSEGGHICLILIKYISIIFLHIISLSYLWSKFSHLCDNWQYGLVINDSCPVRYERASFIWLFFSRKYICTAIVGSHAPPVVFIPRCFTILSGSIGLRAIKSNAIPLVKVI